MKNLSYLFAFILLFGINKAGKTNEIYQKAGSETDTIAYQVEKLAGDLVFTEGPAVDKDGNVYFTDVRQHIILVWTLEDRLDTFRINSGRANGLYFDKNQHLLVCEGDKGQISSTSPEGDNIVIANAYDGKRFNQPNDIWPNKKGGFYFTDPKYGKGDDELPQDGMHVYYVSSNRKVTRVIDDFEKPNGVLGTPDGKTLYVTDAQAKKTYQYDIQKDGSLANKKLFVELGCDGMTMDKEGNIYFTTSAKKAVDVFSPAGKLINSILVPEKPSNVCFGGKDRNQLYITARTSLYRLELDTQGVD